MVMRVLNMAMVSKRTSTWLASMPLTTNARKIAYSNA
jgi:hypothetical protein